MFATKSLLAFWILRSRKCSSVIFFHKAGLPFQSYQFPASNRFDVCLLDWNAANILNKQINVKGKSIAIWLNINPIFTTEKIHNGKHQPHRSHISAGRRSGATDSRSIQNASVFANRQREVEKAQKSEDTQLIRNHKHWQSPGSAL